MLDNRNARATIDDMADKKRSTIPPEKRREICRLGGLARAAKLTPARRSEIAARGWAATAAKHGPDWAARQAAAWRRANPTAGERAVAAVLDYLDVRYERDVEFRGVYPDFVLLDVQAVIEVDCPKWHTNDPLHGRDAAARDAYKDGVYKRAGVAVIRISTDVIDAGGALQFLDAALVGLMRATSAR